MSSWISSTKKVEVHIDHTFITFYSFFQIFDNASEEKARNMKLRLVGMMTYYGKHYTTFFYNTRQRSWFYFDDAKVKEVFISTFV